MKKSRQTITLLMVVFFGFVGVALPYPVLSPLFLDPGATFLAAEYRHILLGLTLAAYPLAQFFGSPILGSLSDSFGRRKLLILTTLGTSFGYLLSGLAIANNAIGLLIISRLLTGFLEGNMGIAQAGIADLGINKYKGLGAVSACASLGYVVGPLLGGFLSDQSSITWFNYAVPFYAASLIAFVLCLFVIMWFTETHTMRRKSRNLLAEFNVFTKLKSVYHKPALRKALLFMVLLSLSVDCYYEFYPAFLVEKWQMTSKLIGLYTVLLSFALGVGAFFVPQYLQKNKNVVGFQKYLLLIYLISLLLLLFANTSLGLNIHFIILGLSYSITTTIQTVVISDNAMADEQGEVMGLQWGLRMLGDGSLCILGSLLLSQSYYFPIILSMIIAGISTCIAWNKRNVVGVSYAKSID